MKKLKFTIIFTLLLLFCSSFTVFAETDNILSEDYQSLTIDGTSYSRIDASLLEIDYSKTLSSEFQFSSSQQETIKDIQIQTTRTENILYVEITFSDNAVFSATYLQDDYLETYNEFTAGQINEYHIDFQWPDGNSVSAQRTDLFSKAVTLTFSDLNRCDYYPVYTRSEDEVLSMETGSLLIVDDTYYYVNFSDFDFDTDYYFDPSDYSELPAYQITSTALSADILAAEEAYYDDDLGFLYDDDFSADILTAFTFILLLLIPTGLFILFLILAIRSKTIYKKFFRTIYILSAAELVMAILFLFLIE